MKWFSIKGIIQETKKVKWPRGKELWSMVLTVFVFIAAFAVLFQLMDMFVVAILKYLGI